MHCPSPALLFSFLASTMAATGLRRNCCSGDRERMKSQKPDKPWSASTVKSIPEKMLIW
jgi:hypothetical protein